MKSNKPAQPASVMIDERIAELGDWRGETLARMRQLIHDAVPEVVETWKWMGTPVFECNGIICTGETYNTVVKLTFARGASLDDPSKLFNSSLEGNMRRAIDIREGERVDPEAFRALVRAAIARNASGARAKPKTKAKAKPKIKPKTKAKAKPTARKGKSKATKAKKAKAKRKK